MVSIIIPTRNRKEYVYKVLYSIEHQTLLPDEIIIVDSSEDVSYQNGVIDRFRKLNVCFIQSEASVCIQRNKGIQAAKGDWILLLDDDIEIEKLYIEKLVQYCNRNPQCGAVAGRLMQQEGDVWVDQYPPPSYLSLLFKFIFQLPVWGHLSQDRFFSSRKFLARTMERYYRGRGNTFSKAGWPLITDWSDSFTTSIYSLGANLLKRDWLIQSPYDEVLDRNGIGDNYGVAIGFPGCRPIHVVSEVRAFHFRASENRLQKEKAYVKRLYALHYFIGRSSRFNKSTIRWFNWSLIGNAVFFLIRKDLPQALSTIKVLTQIILGRNPYVLKQKKRKNKATS